MRQDTPAFALLNESEAKEPRHVIAIEFDVESIYLTSHAGIVGLPGVVIENVSARRPCFRSEMMVPAWPLAQYGSLVGWLGR